MFEEDVNNPLFWNFLKTNAFVDPGSLRLKMHGSNPGFDIDLAIDNIEARRRSARKLSSFVAAGCVFPDTLASEQASDEMIARWHASIIPSGLRVADMTAGLGIDSFALAGKASAMTCFEIDGRKAAALRHNALLMGLDGIRVVEGDSSSLLFNDFCYDVIFVDPARRGADNRRLHAFADTVPDIVPLASGILERGARLFVKGSPMMDLKMACGSLYSVRRIYAVALRGECKEVFIECGTNDSPTVFSAVDIDSSGDVQTFDSIYPGAETAFRYVDFPCDNISGWWLYEPSAAMMKLMPWKSLQEKYPSLMKISRSTHLFLSPLRILGFQGRERMVVGILDKKERHALKGKSLNIVVRNYPDTPQSLRTRLSVRDGGDDFLYACRYGARETPVMILCRRSESEST